jgi:hypothetical protein
MGKVAVLVLIAVVALVLLVGLLFAVDRAIKAIRRGQRRRDAAQRLFAATAGAEVKHKQRKAAAEASVALTSVFPAIADHDTRRVE